jgi:hypothetical protein
MLQALTPHVPVSPVVAMAGTFENGTMWDYGALIAGGAVISTTDNSIYSTWTGLGDVMTMNGTSSSSDPKPIFTVNIQAPLGNIKGKLTLNSVRFRLLWIQSI